MTQRQSRAREQAGDVLVAEYGMSRPLVLQWTVVSTLGFFVSLFGILQVYYAVTGDTTAMAFSWTPDTGWWNLGLTFLVVVGLMILVIVPHELCHGLAMRAFGGQPRYGLGVAYFVFPYAFATTDARFTRNQFVVVALTPLVVLSVVGLPLLLAFEWALLAIPLAMNAGGSVGDLWMALTVLGYPPSVTVVDTTTGLSVYGPPGLERAETAPVAVVWDLLVGVGGGVLMLATVGGIFVPLLLGIIGVDSLVLGIPNSPLLILEFLRTPDGSVEFTMGTGVLAVGVFIGICYSYLRSRRRS